MQPKDCKGKTEAEIAELLAYGGKDAGVLKRFMQEFFPFREFLEIGFFRKEMKNDYYAQAKRVCDFFEYKTVFEYGAEEIRMHLSYAKGHEPQDAKFLHITPSIYD